MVERTNVPEIRFADFTDSWEQRKLGELGSVAMCKRIFKEQTTEQGDVPFYKIGTFGGTPDAFISRELFDEYQRLYQFPKVGDILISAAGTIGRTIVYQGDPAYYQDSNIVWLQHDERLDNGFLLQFLNGKSWSSLEGSTLKRLYNKDLLNAEIATPSPNEQHQIGSTFAKLDDIITLHQRKYDKLVQLKKSMLDKMFPKPGETEPEIRFAGFTDPWEQRKLGELFVESDERSSTEEILSVSVANGIYPASESERDTNPGASIANYKIVRVGDIVYNSMRMWQGAVGSSRYNGIVSPAYVVAKPVVELDSTCFGYLLKRPELLYEYLCNSQGNSKDTQTLRYERFAEITAEVPSTIEEQRAISDCLEGLDNLITLHQRKLGLLRNTKKSLLDRMFV